MAYVNLSKSLISGESRKKAEETSKAIDGSDDLTWEQIEDKSSETSFDDGTLIHAFELYQNGELAGYISVEIPIDLDLAAEIVGYYIKKLNRLKTVLEATKE